MNGVTTIRRRAFTLIELMTVISIIAVMVGLASLGITQINRSRHLADAAHAIADLLDYARTYATANNTYVWVGFYEDNGLVMAAIASQDGSRYPEPVTNSVLPPLDGDTTNPDNRLILAPIGKITKLDQIRLAATNNGINANTNQPPRPAVPAEYQLGGDTFTTSATFRYPPGAAAPRYTFAKIIEFNPLGEASRIGENTFSGPGPADLMEIAFQPLTVSDAQRNIATAVQIEGFSGQISFFLP